MRIFEVIQPRLYEEAQRPYAVINVGANHPSRRENAANIAQIARLAYQKGYTPVIIPPNANYDPSRSSTRYNYKAAHQASLDAMQMLRDEGIGFKTEQGRFGTKGHQGMVHFTGEFSKELAQKYGGPNTLFIGASNISGVARNSANLGLGGTRVATSGLGTTEVLGNVTRHFEQNPNQVAPIQRPTPQATAHSHHGHSHDHDDVDLDDPGRANVPPAPQFDPNMFKPVPKRAPTELDRQLGIVKSEPGANVKLAQFDKEIGISNEPSVTRQILQQPAMKSSATTPVKSQPKVDPNVRLPEFDKEIGISKEPSATDWITQKSKM